MAGPRVLFLAFVTAINAGQVDKMGQMMTDAHVFIDSLGNRVAGRDNMMGGWRSYFALFPDYRIEVEHVSVEGDTVLGAGWASGLLHREGKAVEAGHWRIPAAWRARIWEGKVAEWQVFADNKPVYEILARVSGK